MTKWYVAGHYDDGDDERQGFNVWNPAGRTLARIRERERLEALEMLAL